MSVPYDGSTAAIQVGETFTVRQLIQAMMVCSANEAANMIAEHIGGNIESFSSMMNARAKELGANSTHFLNANGLHEDSHQTTVHDMAIIARYGMQHFEEFRNAASLLEFSLPSTPFHEKEDRSFTNTNKLLISSSSYYYPYATGIKTGFTSKALNCIVASANKDGVELIAVVFGSIDVQNRTDDVKALFEYGFEKLKSVQFYEKGSIIENVNVPGSAKEGSTVAAILTKDVIHTIPATKNASDYPPDIQLLDKIKAPISSGDSLGTVTYHIEGNSYQYELVAAEDVESVIGNVAAVAVKTAKVIGKIIFWAVLSVVGIFIFFVFLRASVISKRQRMRNRRRAIYNRRFR